MIERKHDSRGEKHCQPTFEKADFPIEIEECFVEKEEGHKQGSKFDDRWELLKIKDFHRVTYESPKQQDGVHCGYFVCCYMKDIIITQQTDIPANFVHHPPLPYYSQLRMDQFKLDWMGYLYNRFLR